MLFNDGITNQFGKKKSQAAEEAKAMGIAEQIIDVDALSLSGSEESDDDLSDNGLSGNVVDQVADEAIEIFREKTIEDIIEEQRAKLAAEGKKGTPVTAESFKIW